MNCSIDQVQRNLPFHSKTNIEWDVSFVHANWIFSPALRNEQVHIDGQVLSTCCDDKAHGDLTVRDLAGAARVLPLYARGLFSFLEESCVIKNGDFDGFFFRHLRQRDPNSMATYSEVIPP